MAPRADVPENPVLIFDRETLETHEGAKDHPHRTREQDEAALKVQDEVIDAGRWPMQMQELGEEFEWSRQHMTNTVKNYFRERDTAQNDEEQAVETDAETVSVYINTDDLQKIEIDVPNDVDEDSFVRGYVAALE